MYAPGAVRTALTWWGVAASLCSPLPAQDEPPKFRSGIREVQVHVVVEGGRGNPIADLAADDFLVFDNGQPQHLTHFSVHSRGKLPQVGETLPRNTFSNRLVYKQQAPRGVTALLIDGFNSRFEDQHYAIRNAIQVLREIPLEERVAVYGLEMSGVRVIHDYTADTASLIRRLEKTGSLAALVAEEPGGAGTELAPLGAENGEAMQGRERNRIRLLHTLGALRAVAAHLRQLPGRKGIVWLTTGFGMEAVRNNPDDWYRAMTEINDANVAIYSIDTTGLRLLKGYSASIPATRNLPHPSAPRANSDNDVLKEAAGVTGGTAYESSNDLGKAIRQALDDAEGVYTLAYAPDHDRWNGEFRRIRVKARRGNLRLRHRNGYFADPSAGYDVPDREMALQIASLSPLEASGIGLTVQVTSYQANQAALTVVGRPESLTLHPEQDRWLGGFDVRVVQRSDQGHELDAFTNEVSLNMEESRYQRMHREDFIVTETISIHPDASELRISVCDHFSGNLGSVFVPVGQIHETP